MYLIQAFMAFGRLRLSGTMIGWAPLNLTSGETDCVKLQLRCIVVLPFLKNPTRLTGSSLPLCVFFFSPLSLSLRFPTGFLRNLGFFFFGAKREFSGEERAKIPFFRQHFPADRGIYLRLGFLFL